MFTVLIQNEPTMNSFYEHLPLFNEFVEEKEMDVCLWNEAGMTIEESLPDLHRLTDDKGRWKAVIVRYEDGLTMRSHLAMDDNPYDFLESDWNPEAAHSQNPLVRLCQQLSPPLITNERNQGREVPLFDGIYPDSITIITLRHIDDLVHIANAPSTLVRGEFATRNGYPSSCRFAVVDRMRQGQSRRIEDDFIFWTIVVMLARNRMDSSLMQAYQLYGVKCVLDMEAMEQLWKQKCLELESEGQKIRHLLQYQSVYLDKKGSKYPDYTTRVENLRMPEVDSPENISAREFMRPASNPADQAGDWLEQTGQIEETFQKSLESFPEQIRERLNALHLRHGFQEDEVEILSAAQREKLEKEIHALTLKMIDDEAHLPQVRFEKGDELDLASQAVEEMLKNRLPNGRLLLWVSAFSLAGLACVLPGWIDVLVTKSREVSGLAAISLVLVLAPLVLKWVMNWKERSQIREGIRKWNGLTEARFEQLRTFMDRYAQYLSEVLSYRNAKSYLEISDLKRAGLKEIQYGLEKNLKMISEFLGRLNKWAKAMHLSTEHVPAKIDPDSILEAEALLESQKQEILFTLEPDVYGQCDVNDLGRQISSPFSFITQLMIQPIGRRNQS